MIPKSLFSILLLLMLLGLVTASPSRAQSTYPDHWWAIVSEKDAPAWEVLPQAAPPGAVILSKRNELGVLSNFAATPIRVRGKTYASVEGFWQMMLYPEGLDDPRAKHPGLIWKHTREEVSQMVAFEAKAAGSLAEVNMQQMRIDWVSLDGKRFAYRPNKPGKHYQLILEAMRAKLEQNPEVRRVLLSTGDLKLLPDHHPEPNAPAAWRYNEIWMKIRAGLQGKGGRLKGHNN